MHLARILTATLVGGGIALASAGAAISKGHDMGKADGTRTDPSALRGGVVASNDVPGVGRDADGNFLGVADANHDLTYGQDVVAIQRENDVRRVKPCGVGSKDPCVE